MLPKSEYNNKTVSMTTAKQKYYKQAVCWGKEEKELLSNGYICKYFHNLDYCLYWLGKERLSSAMGRLELTADVDHGFSPLQQVAPL